MATAMVSALLFSLALLLSFWFASPDELIRHGAPSAGMAAGLVIGLAGLAVLQAKRRGGSLWDWRWGAPLLALAGVVAIQAANPSHRFIPGAGWLVPIEHLRALPRSVDRAATGGALLLLGAYSLAFWLGRVLIRDTFSRTVFVVVQAAGGVAMAALMRDQYRQGPDGALYALTGLFVGPNHYAAYANLLWPVCCLWGWDRVVTIRRTGILQAIAGVALCGAGGWIAGSLPLSGSRMGMVVAAIVLVGAVAGEGWAMLRSRWRTRRTALGILAVLMGIGMVGGVVWVIRTESVMGIVAPALGAVQSRLAVYPAVLAMWGDRWFSGVGAGAFELAFPFYQPHRIPGFFRHAHNDFLQLLSEVGLVGLVLTIWAVWKMLTAAPRAVRDDGGPDLSPRERWALVLALGGLGLHAMADFPLRAPILVLLAAAWAGASAGQLVRQAHSGVQA